MTITTTQVQGKVPVTILGIQGDLDASNYKEVIAAAKAIFAAGGRRILIDMSEMHFMSSSGLVALHSIAVLMRGEEPPDPEHGWEAFHAIDRDLDSGKQGNVKLLNPLPRVAKTLEMTGLKQFFDVHSDLDAAVASFG